MTDSNFPKTFLLSSDSLILVFDVALMSLRQAVHDDAIGFFHRVFDVFLPFADGRDGLVDDKAERMPMNEIEASHAGQYIKRTVNRDGDDGKL